MIWLIGCKGMLGSEVAKQLTEKKLAWVGTDKEVDITSPEALQAFEKKIVTSFYDVTTNLSPEDKKISWIINCSAYTNVDKAEEDVELAENLNAKGPLNIARLARKCGAKLIHISTDYVFNGTEKKPYTEDMNKIPLGVYGTTKAQGEDYIEKEMNQYYIIRTAWLYGFDGKNFVYTMTNAMNNRDSVKVVNDQKGSPTCAVDLAEVILAFIDRNEHAKGLFGKNSIPAYGVYHFTNEGETTWFDFTNEIKRLGKRFNRITTDCEVNPCSTEEYGSKAARPAYSVLSKDKIKKTLKIKIPEWQKSLERFIKDERFEIK